MRKIFAFLFLPVFILLLTSCTGPVGPTGETGPAGPQIPGLYFIRIFQEGVYSSSYTGQSQSVIFGGTSAVYYSDSAVPMEIGSKNGATSLRPLIRFDLSSLPSSKIIVDKAELILKTTATYYGSGAENVRFHKITSAWTENQASWTNASTGIAWSSSGGDFDSNTISVNAASFNLLPSTTYTIELDTSVVQNWMINPAGNYGMLLKVDSISPANCSEIYSSGAAEPSNRPMLKIWYYTTE